MFLSFADSSERATWNNRVYVTLMKLAESGSGEESLALTLYIMAMGDLCNLVHSRACNVQVQSRVQWTSQPSSITYKTCLLWQPPSVVAITVARWSKFSFVTVSAAGSVILVRDFRVRRLFLALIIAVSLALASWDVFATRPSLSLGSEDTEHEVVDYAKLYILIWYVVEINNENRNEDESATVTGNSHSKAH